MTRARVGITFVLIFSMATVSMSGKAGAQNLVSNGLFNTDINGWALTGGGPESVITWDGANGSPSPGSLRITSTAEDAALEVLGDCVNGIPGEVLSVTGKVMEPTAQFGVTCYIFLIIYSDLDCVGSRTIPANVPPNTPGAWEDSGIAINIPVTGISARPTLTMELSGAGAGQKDCLFDSVIFESDMRGAPITDIPTLSWSGLLILILLLTIAAMSLFRCSRSRAW